MAIVKSIYPAVVVGSVVLIGAIVRCATSLAGQIDQKQVESSDLPKAPSTPYSYKRVRTITIQRPAVDDATAFRGTAPKRMVLRGECLSLVLLGENITYKCSNTVIGASWDDGRTGFYFSMGADAKLAFGGMGVAEIKPDENAARRPIDFLLFTVGKELHKTNAVGHCVFTNPNTVPATIECHGEADGGKFEAKFKTDRAPE
jgi:hypothetical protein